MQISLVTKIYYCSVIIIVSVIAITTLISLRYSRTGTQDISIIKSVLTEYCVYESEE